jgi:Xaa-Pro aminopeptidase
MSSGVERRFKGLRSEMDKFGVDVVVYGSCQNFQYLTGVVGPPLTIGCWRSGTDLGSPVANLFVGRTGDPILTLPKHYEDRRWRPQSWIRDIRVLEDPMNPPGGGYRYGESYPDLVRQVLSDLDLRSAPKVGLGDHVWASTIAIIAKLVGQTDFVPAGRFLDRVRMVKDETEIGILRRAAKLTDKVMERVLPQIKEGVTQIELELEAERQAKLLGATDVSFSPIVKFIQKGSEKAVTPITYPVEKGLVKDASIAFDIGFVVDGYCSDFGRSFYYGTPEREITEGYEALHASVLETTQRISTDHTRACDLFPIAESYLNKHGFGKYLPKYLPKTLGHSIGVEVHERPWLTPIYEEELKQNTVLAIEPRLWNPGRYYVRVEDMALVGPRKTEFLTNFNRQIFKID